MTDLETMDFPTMARLARRSAPLPTAHELDCVIAEAEGKLEMLRSNAGLFARDAAREYLDNPNAAPTEAGLEVVLDGLRQLVVLRGGVELADVYRECVRRTRAATNYDERLLAGNGLSLASDLLERWMTLHPEFANEIGAFDE